MKIQSMLFSAAAIFFVPALADSWACASGWKYFNPNTPGTPPPDYLNECDSAKHQNVDCIYPNYIKSNRKSAHCHGTFWIRVRYDKDIVSKNNPNQPMGAHTGEHNDGAPCNLACVRGE